MLFLYLITAIAVLVSFSLDKKKTKKALMVGSKKLWKITPPFLTILVGVSISLSLIPQEMIVRYLGSDNQFAGTFIASLIGSITMIPGPIVYPLCSILSQEGVTYSVIAAFSTTLMMVGILTYPMEKAYFGKKFAIIRNVSSFAIALIIALVIGLFKEFI